jgi:predicted DNA-binding transcriptional regulator AlpA
MQTDRVHRNTEVKLNATPEPISVSVSDACRAIGIGRTKFYELLKEPDCPIQTVQIGSRTLVKWESLKRLIEGGVPAKVAA